MSLFESFRLAINSLLLNRMRALLTMLGIVIGVAAVISLLSLGRGVETLVQNQFSGLGADVLTVRSSSPTRGFSTATNPLTDADVTALADSSNAPSVKLVAAQYQTSGTVVDGKNSTRITVQGVTVNYFAVEDWHPRTGSTFTQQDVDSQAQIALLGSTVVEDLYGSTSVDPTGKRLIVNNLVFTIVGVMDTRTATGFNDPNNTVMVPITTAQARLGNARVAGAGYTVSTILAQARDESVLTAATDEIKAYLLLEHGISNPNQADFTVSSATTISNARSQVTQTLTMFLSGIAAISLLVGGIGVLNIMLVSVSERTREIGLRKAVGARAGDILSQFLIESLVLTLIGGGVGIAAGWGITQIVARFISGLTPTLSPDVVLLAFGVSSFIGIFFGAYPANRAARMRPIDALRFE